MEKNYTDEELISGYLTNFATGDKSYFWAYEAVTDLTGTDPERLWLITLQMINRTTDKLTLAYIVAGPLEDILAYHGEVFIDRAEKLAQADSHFREALASVYGSIRFKPEFYARVQKICKNTERI